MVHTFDINTQKADAGVSLNLMPAWSTKPVSGQTRKLKKKNWKEKVSEDIAELEGHVQSQ